MGLFRRWVTLEVESLEIRSYKAESFLKLSPFRIWVLLEVGSLDIQSLELGWVVRSSVGESLGGLQT